MSSNRLAKCIEVVASFEHRNNSGRSVPLGKPHHFLSHFSKVRVFEQKSTQRIASPRIKSGRNDQQVGRKLSLNHFQSIDESLMMRASRGSFAERNVQCSPFALASAGLTRSAGSRIERMLMRRKIKDRRIVIENVLSAVAVMYIPVDDKYSFRAIASLRIACGDRGVVE